MKYLWRIAKGQRPVVSVAKVQIRLVINKNRPLPGAVFAPRKGRGNNSALLDC